MYLATEGDFVSVFDVHESSLYIMNQAHLSQDHYDGIIMELSPIFSDFAFEVQ
jgi:hypothetical protein